MSRNNWERARALWSDVGALTRDLRERVAERPGLPDPRDPGAVDAWASRQLHKHLGSEAKVAIRIALAKMLESTNDPLHHAEAQAHLSYVLGDTPEPRRYAAPGDVILTADEADLVCELLDRVGLELATHPDRPMCRPLEQPQTLRYTLGA
jgi:hypothetical protein